MEQAIKVARNARYEEETTGIVKGRLGLRHDVRVELSNTTGHPATIEVRERLPITSDDEDDIEIIVSEVAPRWEPWEPDERKLRGGHRWVVTVPAGGRQELHYVYVIRIPTRHELVGGNRREW